MAAEKAKKKGLGKGLEALFGEMNTNVSIDPNVSRETSEGKEGAAFLYVSIDDIRPNKMQPRQNFDEKSIEDLSISIKSHGMIQPIIVKKSGKGYELVAGERRLRAARKAKIREIPAIVKEVSDEENAIFAIIENTQRENLNPVEEAIAYQNLSKEFGFTQEETAKMLGKSRPYITNTLRILKLPDEIIEYIRDGRISAGHANAIAQIKDAGKQKIFADQIIREGMTVRIAEKAASKQGKKKKSVAEKKQKKAQDVIDIERELSSLYGTKVTISPDTERGVIELHYYSRDGLEGLVEALTNK